MKSQDILTFLLAERTIIVTVLALVVAVWAVVKWKTEISFFLLRVQYAFPLIGVRAQLARQSAANTYHEGWFSAERRLCEDFRYYVKAYHRDWGHFQKCHSYLDKTEELGRKQLSLIGWAILMVLLAIEAAGFGLVLSRWLIPDISSGEEQWMAYLLAFVLSSIMVYLTHATGHEIYKNGLVKKIKTWRFQYEEDKHQGNPAPPLIPQSYNLQNETEDDHMPRYAQILNRIDCNASVSPAWWITRFTAALILLIALGAAYVRIQAIEQSMHQQQTNSVLSQATSQMPDDSPYGDGGGQSDSQPADTGSSNNTGDSGNSPGDTATGSTGTTLWGTVQFRGSVATYIILSVVFIALQAVGVLVGYKYGFVGQESADARRYMGRFNTATQYKEHWRRKQERVRLIAQKHLGRLQHDMLEYAREGNDLSSQEHERLTNASDRTFNRFIASRDKEDCQGAT